MPLFFQLQQAPVLLVGGGTIAVRKARLLHKAGASLFVVAPTIEAELKAMVENSGGQWIEGLYEACHLADKRLVVSATEKRDINEQVAADCNRINLPVNVVDEPDLCTFIFPSIVDRSPVVIGISSSGKSPVLARLLRSRIEALVPAAYGRLAALTGRFRERLKAVTSSEDQRRRFWEQVINGPVGNAMLAGRDDDAEQMLEAGLEHPESALPRGEVYLIGAGPGDPDLLSFKAARLLQMADVVLYDRLVSSAIVDMSRRDAERIYVGKKRSDHAVPQGEINQLLLQLAQDGRCVARLKGGDPFVFGRGGEEIELLAEHNIPFQVIPGVTAASGCACYAGIPLTHRDHAQSVRFVTGHLKNHQLDLAWDQFQNPAETLVFYMGLQGLATICDQLQAHGRDPATPIALIEQGTTPHQRTLTGTLATMAQQIARQTVHAPTLIIVGSVVSLHGSLSWFGENGAPGSWPPKI